MIAARMFAKLRLGVVMGEQLGLCVGFIRKLLFQNISDSGMQIPAPGLEQAFVGRILYQRVFEYKAGLIP